jgi:hypothetical protein
MDFEFGFIGNKQNIFAIVIDCYCVMIYVFHVHGLSIILTLYIYISIWMPFPCKASFQGWIILPSVCINHLIPELSLNRVSDRMQLVEYEIK